MHRTLGRIIALLCLFSMTAVAVTVYAQSGAIYCKDKDTCTGTDVLCKGCTNDGVNPNPAEAIAHLRGSDCDMTGTDVTNKECKEDGSKTKCKKKQPCNTTGLINNARCPTAQNSCETGHCGKKCRPVTTGIATYDPEQNNKACL
jgi:hypothetical protein